MAKAPVSSGTASGKKVEFISIDNLRFDPDNPRLPSSVKGSNIDEVLEWMLRDASILELMGSIGEKGYFPGEPLLVVPHISEKDTYTVVEGNRRLCATYLLLHPEKALIRKISVRELSENARERPNNLPVLKFSARKEILDYLGYRHVTGIKPWDPLAKAKYLRQLKETLPEVAPDEQNKALAKAIGSRRSDYVAALLTALALHDQIKEKGYFDIKALDEDSISFSLLTTSLSYSNIVAFLGLTSRADPTLKGLKIARLKELTSWMFEKVSEGKTRIGESRNLSMLNSVVSHKEALLNFRSGKTLREASLLTGMPAQIFSKAIMDSIGHLKLAREQQHHVDNPTKFDEDNLREIQAIARDLRIVVSSKLTGTDS